MRDASQQVLGDALTAVVTTFHHHVLHLVWPRYQRIGAGGYSDIFFLLLPWKLILSIVKDSLSALLGPLVKSSGVTYKRQETCHDMAS